MYCLEFALYYYWSPCNSSSWISFFFHASSNRSRWFRQVQSIDQPVIIYNRMSSTTDESSGSNSPSDGTSRISSFLINSARGIKKITHISSNQSRCGRGSSIFVLQLTLSLTNDFSAISFFDTGMNNDSFHTLKRVQ